MRHADERPFLSGTTAGQSGQIARYPRGLLSALAMVGLAALLLLSTFNGAARYYLEKSGLVFMIYIPAAMILACVLILLFIQLTRGHMPSKDIGLWGLLLISFLIGLIQIGNPQQTAFGLYVLLPFIFGYCYASSLLDRLASIRRLMLLVWIFSIIGLVLDYSIEVPWRGFGYQVGALQVEANREWTTFGLRRLSGFSRASFELAALLLMSALFTMFHWRSRAMRLALWAVTGFAIFLTTSKGVLFALAVLSLAYVLHRLGMRRAIGWMMVAVMLALIALPLTAWLYSGANLATGLEDDILLQSMGERFTQMWPEAFQHANDIGNPFWGAGLGSIGVPLTYFSNGFQNSADNIFVYLYSLVGLFALPLILYVVVRAKSFASDNKNQGPDAFLMLQALLGTLIYGITTNVIESSVLGLILGFSLGAMLSVKSPYRALHRG